MKITVLFNRVKSMSLGRAEDILADQDSVETANAINQALLSLGYKSDLFEITEKNFNSISKIKTDIFFNQAFGIGNLPKTEAQVTEKLERIKTPFTGSDSRAILLTTNKVATKDLLLSHNLPTPKFQFFDTPDEQLDSKLSFPLIIKPVDEDCSLGLDENSVVSSEQDLYNRIALLRDSYSGLVLVEEFIDGRELNVSVLGNGRTAEVLPVSEVIFGPYFNTRFKIIDFAAKWVSDSPQYKNTDSYRCPAVIDSAVSEKIAEISKEAFRITGCRDYARIDIRLSNDNVPYILEVNANPAIGPLDGSARSAKAAGFSYPQFLQKILELALERYH